MRTRRPLSIKEMEYERIQKRYVPRPIDYRGVTFRSTLEAHFAFYLDMKGERWAYEPRRYGKGTRSYLPDFQLLDAIRPTFVELKPLIEDVPAAKEKMRVIWLEEPDALLIVATAEHRRFYASLRGGDWSEFTEEWAA